MSVLRAYVWEDVGLAFCRVRDFGSLVVLWISRVGRVSKFVLDLSRSVAGDVGLRARLVSLGAAAGGAVSVFAVVFLGCKVVRVFRVFRVAFSGFRWLLGTSLFV